MNNATDNIANAIFYPGISRHYLEDLVAHKAAKAIRLKDEKRNIFQTIYVLKDGSGIVFPSIGKARLATDVYDYSALKRAE